MSTLLMLLCFSVAFVCPTLAQQKSCYAQDDNPYLFYASKTAYEFVNDKSTPKDIADCEPAQIWLLARHGTRYPDRKEIKEMETLKEIRNQIVRNHEERQDGYLCNEDLQNLKQWTLDVSPVQADELSNQGSMDMKFIARRYKTRFPALLTQDYDTQLFTFRYTDTQRTRSSAEAFASGLFSSSGRSPRLPEPIVNDTLLEPYRNCTTWQKEVNDNPQSALERDLFINGTLVQKLLQNVSDRLGFKYKLTIKQVKQIWNMCRYDKAWSVEQLSPWCAAFNKTDLQILEYMEDLKYYYRQGYGNDLNMRLGCPLVKDLVKRFSKLEESIDDQPVGVFYFTHSAALQMTLSALGIAKDVIRPVHTNYELMQKRHWKVSQIGPFAGNIAAVFYKCSKGDPHRIMFYLQERIVPYEGCSVGLCSWTYIKEKFSKLLNECNLKWCHEGANSSPSHESTLFLVLPLVAIIAVKNFFNC